MASYLLDLQQLTIEALYRIPWPATLALLLNTIIGLLGLVRSSIVRKRRAS
jgi:hypothetical protein